VNPISHEDPSAPRQTHTDAAGHQEATILVAEDDPGLRQTIEWTLQDEGLAVELASDGVAALEMLRRHRPALLMLDMGLPRIDGIGVAAGLREVYGDKVPILVITADGRAQEKARHVGAVDYLRKPFDVDDLVHAVRQALG
jgi:DNA-binding response OmpR family regulator